jgi:hypothetical protein
LTGYSRPSISGKESNRRIAPAYRITALNVAFCLEYVSKHTYNPLTGILPLKAVPLNEVQLHSISKLPPPLHTRTPSDMTYSRSRHQTSRTSRSINLFVNGTKPTTRYHPFEVLGLKHWYTQLSDKREGKNTRKAPAYRKLPIDAFTVCL